MSTIYLIAEDGFIAYRIDGDPMSDGFFYPENLGVWLEEKKAMGARITYLNPPREDIWGGPHVGWAKKVRVVMVVEV